MKDPGSGEQHKVIELASHGKGKARRAVNLTDPGMPDPAPAGPSTNRQAWRQWLASPAGQYVLQWEQQELDRLVTDLFGFIALQCGLPEVDALSQNRMRSRALVSRGDSAATYGDTLRRPDVIIESYEELPFGDQTVDLVVLPHVLEFATDPHQTLREVDRVLRPEGRLLVTGFNPVSLWGARQMISRGTGKPFLSSDGQFISLPRLRDWYKLLSFEFTRGSYGCYRPPHRNERWLNRMQFMEKAGDRWWPICGAVYCVSAVKRVRGMRVIGPAWKRSRAHQHAPVVVSPNFSPQPAPIPGQAASSESHSSYHDD